MPTTNSPGHATGFVVDRATHTIRLVRMVDASPAQVFAAWTEPDQVTRWWDPSGQPLASCKIDLRPGGEFVFTPQGRPEIVFAGKYLDIVAGERLTFEAMGAMGHVHYEPAGDRTRPVEDRTRMTVEIQCRSAEHLEQFLQLGVHEGTAQTLDNLVAHFSRAQG